MSYQSLTNTLPSIQCMLNGVQAKRNILLEDSFFRQPIHLKPLEPTFCTSIDIAPKFNIKQSTIIGHTHTHTHTLTQSRIPSTTTTTSYHLHKRTQSDHTFEYTQAYYSEDINDSVDSGSQTSLSSSSSPAIYRRARLLSLQGYKYNCPYCQKGFSRPSSLKTHIFSHTGEKPYTCSYPSCNRSFSVQSNMRRHMKIHQNNNDKSAETYYL
ncbi:uncharacterized protein BX663DRAFT_500898 [Cokeromyces recurvatus]|uniref:uncharacterized protein n=1 Tax=Cokeromyces recurvatus TaxID=90255 RepID=UPI00221E78CD|nr:uncharacterized protein BX663DRAFT_500898 [Cokeromyces recurvatus]KAI7905784.1 hypothetical protein BX663DRAFT_500898 [Cokeromyces recurvatus]